MDKKKLNFRFHNPNPAEATADYILKVLVQANIPKADESIKEAVTIEELDEERSA